MFSLFAYFIIILVEAQLITHSAISHQKKRTDLSSSQTLQTQQQQAYNSILAIQLKAHQPK